MSIAELTTKFLEGIREGAVRADIITVIGMLTDAYSTGRLSDSRLITALKELCLDVLMEKNPLKDPEELKEEAEEWAKAFYRAIRLQTIRSRYTHLTSSE